MSVMDGHMDRLIPDIEDLHELLGAEPSAEVIEMTTQNLLMPVRDVMGRPHKNFRGELVSIGYQLVPGSDLMAIENQEKIRICSEIIELLHAGSLVVDDIEDQSPMRRGKPTLHQIYSLPIALNSGNWLYFWPLHRIQALGITPEQEVLLHRLAHQTLMRAHFGQAIDLGTPIDQLDQSKVASVCLSSMQLKSGALMAFALAMGAIIGGADAWMVDELSRFGNSLGTALQMFDDVGNLTLEKDGKRLEDLKNRRPSWIWAVAAQESVEEYQLFLSFVRSLPDEGGLQGWMSKSSLVQRARDQARAHLQKAFTEVTVRLAGEVSEGALIQLEKLSERIAYAYQ